MAWVITMPAAGLIGAVFYLLAAAFGMADASTRLSQLAGPIWAVDG